VSDWIADRLADSLTKYRHGGSTIPRWCRYRVGTVKSFLNIDIRGCFDAKTTYKINEVSYSLKNNCYRRHNYYD
jgi:hypothetical protein